MTVCIAMAFTWIYSDHDLGQAILTASDRMLTAGDIQYEPTQQKLRYLTPTTVIMMAGDMAAHSEALAATLQHIENKRYSISTSAAAAKQYATTREIADFYASQIISIRLRRAATLYLAPLGLDEKTFLLNQKTLLPQVVVDLTNEMRTYSMSVEALVVGCEGDTAAILQIDGEGIITHHQDINFAAIGIGAYHAKSYLMFSRYQRFTSYFRALPFLYRAKKQAEVAPGVGDASDYHLINKHGAVPVDPRLIEVLTQHYKEEEERRENDILIIERKLSDEAISAVATLPLANSGDSLEEAPSSQEPPQSGRIPQPVAPSDGKPA